MTARLQTMSGEELLLARIFGGPEVHADVARELDRRALLGKRKAMLPRRHDYATVTESSGLLVA